MEHVEQKRGLIVEQTGRKVTALTRSGEFVTFKSSREDLMPGMEIIIPAPVAFPAFAWKRLAPALALSMVVLLVSFFGYRQYLYAQPLMAYLTLDGAGSIELEVNKAGLVKAATPIDEAGSQALAKVDYLNKPAEKVVSALLQLPDAKESTEVVVAVIPVKEDPGVDSLEKKVLEKAEKPAPDPKAEPRTVTAFRLDTETRESAKKLGISAGRAALWALSHQAAETIHVQGQETPDARDKGGQPETLDAVKESLPKVSQNEVKEKEKSLKDITKDWVNKITEELRKEEESRKGQGQPGGKNEEGQGSGEGKEGSPGAGSKGGTKGTSQAIPPSSLPAATPSSSGRAVDGTPVQGREPAGGSARGSAAPSEKRAARLQETLENFLRRLPWSSK